MKSDRIIGLDIVRVIAIIIVVIYHSAPLLAPLRTIPGAGAYIHKALALTEPLGILGVELFFVLSGFLIGGILIKIFTRSEQYGLAEIKSFLVRRWFRTVPNYWLILIANLVLYTILGLHSFDGNYSRYFLFVQNLWYRHPDFFPEAWSLAVEEWFYLTLPAVLYATSRLFSKYSKQRKILLTFVFYAASFFLLRLFLTDNTNTNPLYFDWGVRKIVFFRLDAISYGVFVAYLNFYYQEQLLKWKRSLLAISIAGIVLTTGIHYMGIHPRFNLYAASAGYRLFHNTVMMVMIPLFFSMCIPYAFTVRQIQSKRISAVITTISQISYSMYLVHFTLILLPLSHFVKLTMYNCVPVFIFYWVIVIVVSMLLYRYYELPTMALRKKLSKPEPGI